MTNSAPCPQCQSPMFFSPDGRFRICDRCGHKQSVEKERQSPRELALTQQMSGEEATGFVQVRDSGVRELLGQGIASVKNGDLDEAYHYLTWVLRTDANHAHQAKAWLWLSQVFPDNADKRYCLEQTLAIDPQHGVARRGLAIIDGRLKQEEVIDPNKLDREIKEMPEEVHAEQFTCPNCAGHMNYAPDGQSLLCEFCNYRQALDVTGQSIKESRFGQGALEQDFSVGIATAKGHLEPIQMRTFQCQGCAVEFVLPPKTLSITCPYCSSVYVTDSAESHEIMPPHALIPFTISHFDAKKVLRSWFEIHKIVHPRVSPFVGIYLPVWTFDVGGEVRWNGLVKKGDDWVSINGSHLAFYDDVIISGSKKLPDNLVRGFEQFDLSKITPYDARYLADWPAERYQQPLADASLIARKKVLKDLRKNASQFTHGNYVRDLRLNSLGLVVESFKLLLLPMWVIHYKLEGATYDVVINGQSGIVQGERPQHAIRKFWGRLMGQ